DLAVEIGGIALSADTPDQDAVDEATAILSGAIAALVAVPDLADITPDSTEFFTEISWLAREGITTGWDNGDGTHDFRPTSPITRDAMAAFLYRFAGEPEVELPAESPFVDVTPTSTEFYTEIVWMYQEGLSTGWETPAGREYRPLSHVKRDAMAAFLYRFAGSPAWEDPAQSPFVDVTADSTEFFTEITWLADTGITTGWETPAGDEYRPLSHVKRDAMAAFLYRFSGM
ncbi:MAG: S-layer homology domain-containing protein, partial [Actinomycetes bacterium]